MADTEKNDWLPNITYEVTHKEDITTSHDEYAGRQHNILTAMTDVTVKMYFIY